MIGPVLSVRHITALVCAALPGTGLGTENRITCLSSRNIGAPRCAISKDLHPLIRGCHLEGTLDQSSLRISFSMNSNFLSKHVHVREKLEYFALVHVCDPNQQNEPVSAHSSSVCGIP